MGIIVLPAESLHLWPETPAASLGLLIALTGLTNMISPLAGYYSDRCTHWLGRRRPFMIGGTVLALLGLLGMQLSSIYLYPAMYVISLLLTMTGLTTATMGHTGLLPDLLPDAVMGKASGVLAMFNAVGAATAFAAFGFGNMPVGYSYGAYGAIAIVTVCISCLAADEKRCVDPAPARVSELIETFKVSEATHKDFFWVFWIRVFYYMGVSVLSFMLLYLRDMTLPRYGEVEEGEILFGVVGATRDDARAGDAYAHAAAPVRLEEATGDLGAEEAVAVDPVPVVGELVAAEEERGGRLRAINPVADGRAVARQVVVEELADQAEEQLQPGDAEVVDATRLDRQPAAAEEDEADGALPAALEPQAPEAPAVDVDRLGRVRWVGRRSLLERAPRQQRHFRRLADAREGAVAVERDAVDAREQQRRAHLVEQVRRRLVAGHRWEAHGAAVPHSVEARLDRGRVVRGAVAARAPPLRQQVLRVHTAGAPHDLARAGEDLILAGDHAWPAGDRERLTCCNCEHGAKRRPKADVGRERHVVGHRRRGLNEQVAHRRADRLQRRAQRGVIREEPHGRSRGRQSAPEQRRAAEPSRAAATVAERLPGAFGAAKPAELGGLVPRHAGAPKSWNGSARGTRRAAASC